MLVGTVSSSEYEWGGGFLSGVGTVPSSGMSGVEDFCQVLVGTVCPAVSSKSGVEDFFLSGVGSLQQ